MRQNRYFLILICMLFVSCGGGGTSSNEENQPIVATLTVAALFPNNGKNWNDYVNRGTDVGCVVGNGSDCTHGGEQRLVILDDSITSCAGISADDSLQAFNWYCDESTTPVRVISTGLKQGKTLLDLLDITQTQPVFKPNSLLIKNNGQAVAASTSVVWWDNQLSFLDPNAPLMNEAGKIYVAKEDQPGLSISAHKISLLFVPGVVGSSLSSDGFDHLWLEVSVNAQGSIEGITWSNTNHSVAKRLEAFNGGTYNMTLNLIRNSRLENIVVANSGSYGIRLFNLVDCLVKGFRSYNNKAGVFLSSIGRTTFIGMNVSHNGNGTLFGTGMALNHAVNGNVFMAISAMDNEHSGIWAGQSASNNFIQGNVYSNIFVAGNENGLVHNPDVTTQTYHNVIATNNREYGVWFSTSNNNTFTGYLKVGSNGIRDCAITGVDPGLVTDTCMPQGTSDFTAPSTGIDASGSFKGPVIFDETNTTDNNGINDYSLLLNWVRFDHAHRSWGKNANFGEPVVGKACLSGDVCRIWDWSLQQNDTVVVDGNANLPIGTDTLSINNQTFLKNAYEINMGPGDGDGLCEAGETCLFTPNSGFYQGHGAIVPAGNFISNGGLNNIRLYRYQYNGR